MKKTILLAGAISLLIGVSGCGSESHETYVKEMIDVLRKTRDVLANIKNVKQAEEQADNLKEQGARLTSLRHKVDNLKEPLSAEEKDQLSKDYRDKLQKALADVASEWKRVEKIKGVRAALDSKDALKGWTYNR